MKYTLLILAGAFVFFSCKKDNCQHNDSTFERIDQGVLYGDGEEGISADNLVIKTQNEWDELIAKMNSVNNVSSEFSVSNIDFSESMVIACFDEIRPNGGCSITITSITHDDNQIIVDVNSSLPNNGNAITVITQPYDLVIVDKCGNNVVFE